MSPPYPVADSLYLSVPIPVVSVATTPVLLTKLVIDTATLVIPYPNIALSPPYPAAAKSLLAVPTPATLLATIPMFDTKLTADKAILPL